MKLRIFSLTQNWMINAYSNITSFTLWFVELQQKKKAWVWDQPLQKKTCTQELILHMEKT